MTHAKCLFIAGTDTDIGKSYVSAVLVKQLLTNGIDKVAYYKPVQTGVDYITWHGDDAFVEKMCRPTVRPHQTFSATNGYSFKVPAAPLVSDPEHTITFEKIKQDIDALKQKFDVVIIEGAGGLMVPVTPNELLIDWIEALELPTFLVTANKLGTINHTLLSLNLLAQKQINIAGVIMNHPQHVEQNTYVDAVNTNLEQLKQFAPNHLQLYTVPYSGETDFNELEISPNDLLIENFTPLTFALN